jgi:hypothetical protein
MNKWNGMEESGTVWYLVVSVKRDARLAWRVYVIASDHK